MLDEAVANVTCALRANGMGDNTIMVLVSDNGCDADTIVGCSYPFAGSQSTHARGGVSSRAIINSQLLPESRRGTVYEGLAHVTDWLPTLMGLATEAQWTGSYSGADLDGIDLWDAIVSNTESPRHEILHELKREDVSIQIDNMKLDASHVPPIRKHKPDYTFTADADPTLSRMTCEWPSLWSYKPTPIPSGAPSKPPPPSPAPTQAPKSKATPPTNAPSNAPKPKTTAPSVAAKAAEAPKSSGGAATTSKASPGGGGGTTTTTIKTSSSEVESSSSSSEPDPMAQLLADAVASFSQGEPLSDTSSSGKSELELGSHASVATESNKEGTKDGDGKEGGEASKSHTAEASSSSSSKNDDKQSGPKTSDTTAEAGTTTSATASDATSSDGASTTSTTPELTLSQLEAILSATGTSASEVTMDQLESIQAIFTDSSSTADTTTSASASTTDTSASSSEVMESAALMTSSAHSSSSSSSTSTGATGGTASESHNSASASSGSGSGGSASAGTSGSGGHSSGSATASGSSQSAGASTGANGGSSSSKGGSTQESASGSAGHSESGSGNGSGTGTGTGSGTGTGTGSSAGSSGSASKGASSEGGGNGGASGSGSTSSSNGGGASNGAASHSTGAGGSSSTTAGSVSARYASLVQTGGNTYTTNAHIQVILWALLFMIGMAVMVSRQRQSSSRSAQKNRWWVFGDTENTGADRVNGRIDSIDTAHKVSNSKSDHSFDVIDYESGRGNDSSSGGSMIGYGTVGYRGLAAVDGDTDSSIISEQSRLLDPKHDTSSPRINKYSS